MLAALLRSFLQERRIEVTVESAGLKSDGLRRPASENATAAMRERGLDLSAHGSAYAGNLDLNSYDLVLCMDADLAGQLEKLGVPRDRVEVLNAEAGGVPNPYGGDLETYRKCTALLETLAQGIAQRYS